MSPAPPVLKGPKNARFDRVMLYVLSTQWRICKDHLIVTNNYFKKSHIWYLCPWFVFRKDFLSQLPSRKDFLSHAYHDGGALNFILDDGGLWNHSEEPNTGNYRTRVRSFSTLFANSLTDWLGPKNIPTCLWDVSLEQEEDQTLYLLTPCVTLPQERTLWLLTELAMQTFWCLKCIVFMSPIICKHSHTHIYCWPVLIVMLIANRRGAQRRLCHLWAPCLACSSLQVRHPLFGCLDMLSYCNHLIFNPS